MTERLLVVGGDAAGATAAAQARRRVRDRLDIIVFERSGETSVSSCGIPYYVAGLVDDPDDLVARSPEEHRRRGVDVRVHHDVVGIDPRAGTVTVHDLDAGTERVEPYDHLVIATGARPRRPPVPGLDAPGIFGVQHLDDGLQIRGVLAARKPRQAVIVGGGYIGLEMAEALVEQGLEVALVEAAEQPMTTLDPDMGARVAEAVRKVGINLHLGTPVQGFETSADGYVTGVALEHRTLPADLVILGLGVVPDVTLARDAGVTIGPSGGIATDDHQRTSAPEVYAAGDCCETRHRVSGRPVAVALGTHANKQGLVAGTNATGGDATFPGVLGSAVTKVCAYEIARTGLNEREAADAGYDALGVAIEAHTRARYYPGVAPIHVKLVCERPHGRVLGAQIVGSEGAAKRIDVLVACIWNEMPVGGIVDLDLGYAPPVSPLWDPIQVAARAALVELAGRR